MNSELLREERPTLTGDVVCLRPMRMEDAPAVAELANDPAIHATTLSVPHPYRLSDAEQFINRHADRWMKGEGLELAVVDAPTGTLAGCVGLAIKPAFEAAELGYWIGQRYWGRGYASGAAGLMIRFALGPLGWNRVFAHHLSGNDASGRVMIKNRMRYEGLLREAAHRDGRFTNLLLYAILAKDLAETAG
jgi:[ribosomal protein S5]-alanine N-acetyltransferase